MTTTVLVGTRVNRSGLRQAVRAEMIKVATLRSVLWTVLITVVGSITITILSTHSVAHSGNAYQGFDPTNQALGGLVLATLTLGVLGVLGASSEYGSGTIRTSLAGVPKRATLAVSKVLVLGGLALVLGEVLAFSCFGIGQAVLAAAGAPTASLTHGAAFRAVALSGLSLPALAVLGLGLGLLVRYTAGALAAYAVVTFLLPFTLQRIPSDPSRFTPIPIVANTLAATLSHPGQVSVPLGFSLIVLYAVVVLGVGLARLLRHDA